MTIELLTEPQPAEACMDALATGRLVPDPNTGLAIAASSGEVSRVMWPFGYSAQYVDGALVLFDDDGTAVAAAGDTIQMGGGSGANGLFYACSGTVERVTT
jgi:hypothetical protein